MSRILAQNGFEGLIFVVMAVVWAVVQVLNRVGRRTPESPKGARGKPKRKPSERPGAGPASPPEDDLRRFLEELAGVEPKEETTTPPPLPQRRPATQPAGPPRQQPTPTPAQRPATAPAPMRAPDQVRTAYTASPPNERTPSPKPFVPRSVSRKPEQKIALRMEEAGADILERFHDSSSGPLSISMPAFPMIRISGSAGLSVSSQEKQSGRTVFRTGDRAELRRAVLLSAILGAPRAIAPVGSDLPYGDSV